jgi:hypothetical protein
MLDHPAEAARMAAAARRQVGQEFQAGALGQELADVYDSALRNGARHRRALAA